MDGCTRAAANCAIITVFTPALSSRRRCRRRPGEDRPSDRHYPSSTTSLRWLPDRSGRRCRPPPAAATAAPACRAPRPAGAVRTSSAARPRRSPTPRCAGVLEVIDRRRPDRTTAAVAGPGLIDSVVAFAARSARPPEWRGVAPGAAAGDRSRRATAFEVFADLHPGPPTARRRVPCRQVAPRRARLAGRRPAYRLALHGSPSRG